MPTMLRQLSAWIVGVNIQFHFSSNLSCQNTLLPQIIPFYCKDGISLLLFGFDFTCLAGCFKHLFFSVALRLNYLFFLFGAEKLQEFRLLLLLGYQCYDRCTPFSVIFTLIDHPCFNFEENFFVNLSLSNLSPPRNMAQTLLPWFRNYFQQLWTRSLFITWTLFYDQVMQNNGSTIFSFHFKSSSEFFILLHFQELTRILHIAIFLQVILAKTIFCATIVVHENFWDSLKAPPDFFTFMWYSCRMWVITKTFPAM